MAKKRPVRKVRKAKRRMRCIRVGSCLTCFEAVVQRDPSSQMVCAVSCRKGCY